MNKKIPDVTKLRFYGHERRYQVATLNRPDSARLQLVRFGMNPEMNHIMYQPPPPNNWPGRSIPWADGCLFQAQSLIAAFCKGEL